jgi:hypothetical protein
MAKLRGHAGDLNPECCLGRAGDHCHYSNQSRDAWPRSALGEYKHLALTHAPVSALSEGSDLVTTVLTEPSCSLVGRLQPCTCDLLLLLGVTLSAVGGVDGVDGMSGSAAAALS